MEIVTKIVLGSSDSTEVSIEYLGIREMVSSLNNLNHDEQEIKKFYLTNDNYTYRIENKIGEIFIERRFTQHWKALEWAKAWISCWNGYQIEYKEKL